MSSSDNDRNNQATRSVISPWWSVAATARTRLPTRRRWLSRALTAAAWTLFVVLVWTLLVPEPTGVPAAERIVQVRHCREAAVTVPYNREGLRTLLAQRPGEEQCPWASATLPLREPTQNPAANAHVRPVQREWVQARYVLPDVPGPARTLTVHIPRVSGEAWTLWVDGQPVADNLHDWRMTWNRPLTVSVPLGDAHWQAGREVDVRLNMAHGSANGYGIAPMRIGVAAALEREVAWNNALMVALPQAATATLLLLSAFFFAFWLARREERAHLLLALTGLTWGICNLQYVLPRHDDARLDFWYSSVVDLSLVWVMWFMYLIVLRFDTPRVRWVTRVLPWYVLGATLLALVPNLAFGLDAGLLNGIASASVASLIATLVLWHAWHGDVEIRFIAVALALTTAAGIHDLTLYADRQPAEGIYLMPFTSLLLFGAFLYATQRRYVRAIAESEALRRTLTERLAEQLATRESELNTSHTRLMVLERAQAMAEERQRVMRDIHDGIGSTLASTLAALEHRELSTSAAAEALRDCVQDLRLMIDSLDPVVHDVGTLLGTLRWRLGRRLEAAGLTLHWEVGDTPALSWLEAPQALQLLRMVQEALTNVVKHAQARNLHVRAGAQAQHLVLEIADDGIGFDPAAAATVGRGLRGMKARARDLGARLAFDSQPGHGTTWRLHLPLQAPSQTMPPLPRPPRH